VGSNPTPSASCPFSVLTAIERRHDQIRGAFYSGLGLVLQQIDAELMMKVEGRCPAEGIVGLPIHDSFVVASANEARVIEIMDHELANTLREIDIEIAQ
jgi:hypothetical protein